MGFFRSVEDAEKYAENYFYELQYGNNPSLPDHPEIESSTEYESYTVE